MRLRNWFAIVATASAMIVGCGGNGSSAGPSDAGEDRPSCSPIERATEEVTVDNELGTLYGTLELPAVECGPVPAVLIVAGSGPTDRDGNGPALFTDAYKLLAVALADHGIASIRYDKRGIARSRRAGPLSEEATVIEDFANDIPRWVELMRADPRFASITVAGHSEGSLLAMIAAKKIAFDGFISLAGPGRPLGALLREQIASQTQDAELLKALDRILTELEAGRIVPVAEIPEPLKNLFRRSVQPFLISALAYDPAKEIRAVSAPTLIAQGTTDIQVKVLDAELLAAAKPDATLVIIEGMNHTLKHANLSDASQERAYIDPSLPVVPELVDHIVAFEEQL